MQILFNNLFIYLFFFWGVYSIYVIFLGIVLNKARMTKRGKANSNIANGALIETLVILSGDLVQLVAKVRNLCPFFLFCLKI